MCPNLGGRTTYRADVGSGGGVETEGLEEKGRGREKMGGGQWGAKSHSGGGGLAKRM